MWMRQLARPPTKSLTVVCQPQVTAVCQPQLTVGCQPQLMATWLPRRRLDRQRGPRPNAASITSGPSSTTGKFPGLGIFPIQPPFIFRYISGSIFRRSQEKLIVSLGSEKRDALRAAAWTNSHHGRQMASPAIGNGGMARIGMAVRVVGTCLVTTAPISMTNLVSMEHREAGTRCTGVVSEN